MNEWSESFNFQGREFERREREREGVVDPETVERMNGGRRGGREKERRDKNIQQISFLLSSQEMLQQ